MTRVATSVVINRPPEEVFEFISNFENNSRWQSGMREASGFFRLAGPILNRMVQRQVSGDYTNLKELLESQPA